VILEAQQKMLDAEPDRKLLDINVDAPGIAARRMVARDIEAERGV
jgi:hypothetical protein